MEAPSLLRPPAVQMLAAVVTAPGEARLEQRPRPEPAPGELLIRVQGCGICASSIPLWQGRAWFTYPLRPGQPGHEGWGIVEQAGSPADERLVGARVAFISDRAFAEYDVAPTELVVPLPPELESRPFPGEAFGCVVNAFRRSDVRAGQTVAIVGMGFLGSAFAQVARAAGAEIVEVRRGTDWQPWSECCERVVEAAGTQAALDTASRLVRVGGRLVIAGYHQDGLRAVDMQSWNWRGLEIVNAHERDPAVQVAGMREAARLAAEATLDLEALVTHRFPLRRLADANAAASSRPAGFVKAWVEP
jgi:threonine dehydrogenase-like Zn-dependent dehydrogenase